LGYRACVGAKTQKYPKNENFVFQPNLLFSCT